MKIVGLLAFRDEEPYLPYLMTSLRSLVDHVIAVNDQSSDQGPELLASFGATVVDAPPMSTFGSRRQLLLEHGRRSGGSHFVMVDADEAFTAPFSAHGRAVIESLKPGQALAFPFRTLWKGWTHYRVGREYDMPLTTVFCDDGDSAYPDTRIHESRFPGTIGRTARRLAADEGSMVHFQFTAWERSQIKQAWYRCRELLDERSPSEVNARYIMTLDGPLVRRRELDPTLIAHLPAPDPLSVLPPSWHLSEILDWFARYGATRFEPLQIWHVPQLRRAFTENVGREPRPQRWAPHSTRFRADWRDRLRAARRRAAARMSGLGH